jgi:HPt (histidine-containing phosphotransfer) domain-containing protein
MGHTRRTHGRVNSRVFGLFRLPRLGMVRAQLAHMAIAPCDALLARVDGDLEVFNELCDLFLDDAPNRIVQIGRAIEAQDARALQSAAHAFKGAASVFEAEDVVSLARQLEHMGADNDLGEAAQLFATLESNSRKLLDDILANRHAVPSCRS